MLNGFSLPDSERLIFLSFLLAIRLFYILMSFLSLIYAEVE